MLLKGKKGLIMGLANNKSLAWGVASMAKAQGAELAFTYVNDAIKKRVEPLAAELESNIILPCDVSSDTDIERLFNDIEDKWGKIDFILHAIGFSDKNELKGKYFNSTIENFTNTMNISCFSFTAIAKHAYRLMNDGGSLVTLTYYGSEKVIPNYNIMGVAKAALEASVKYLAADMGDKNIRVNAISAGPVRTLAASGIGDFKQVLNYNAENSPLKRNTNIEDVGGVATFLFSQLSSNITGENIHVDSGYHAIGMPSISFLKGDNE